MANVGIFVHLCNFSYLMKGEGGPVTNIVSLILLSLQVSVSSCDLLVVSVGQMSMGRAINIVQKFWTAGIPAEIMYDWSQVEFFISVC